MSHTPGPWKVCNVDFRAVEGPDGLVIADIRSKSVESGREDADLIAAAPDLLAALEEILQGGADDAGNGYVEVTAFFESVERGRAAIKKARGE